MATLEVDRAYLSVARILRAPDPRKELTDELVAFLSAHLKALGIRWNPKAFRAGLKNSLLPEELLRKLEDFLGVAESLNWSLPNAVVEALDHVLEDIESFNPAFVASLNASHASGRVAASVVRKRLGP